MWLVGKQTEPVDRAVDHRSNYLRVTRQRIRYLGDAVEFYSQESASFRQQSFLLKGSVTKLEAKIFRLEIVLLVFNIFFGSYFILYISNLYIYSNFTSPNTIKHFS